MLLAADFETTTDPLDCRVWAWAILEIGKADPVIIGNTIDSFIDWCKNEKENHTLYFHNAKFDTEFIMCYLFKNGFIHVKDRKDLKSNTFCTLINDMGTFYSMEICFSKIGKHVHKIKILDSYKLLPLSIENIAKTFNLEFTKLELDYTEYREYGHVLTELEENYLKNDVRIASLALKQMFDIGLQKMTIGANALKSYKEEIEEINFKRWFPIPEFDKQIRESYRGGFTYLSPSYAGKDIGEGIVLDVNSLYPSVMYYKPMPYGEGMFFDGKYEEDKLYNLYIQFFRCNFYLKKDKIPTVQIKNDLAFVPNEYLTTNGDEYITLAMTNVDLELFLEHYHVYDIDWVCGWKFKSSDKLFRKYIDVWNEIKIQATEDGNSGLRQIAKLMLNNLYGKFATNPNVQEKYPYFGEDNIIHYHLGEKTARKPVYIPVGTFITSWARWVTITSAQKLYSRFIYADTDSLHLEGSEIPDELEISDTKLGAWKVEEKFTRARFIKQKSYIEEIDGKLKVTCAGLPKSCYQYVTWENFHKGSEYEGKLKMKHVPGGVVLYPSPHKIK